MVAVAPAFFRARWKMASPGEPGIWLSAWAGSSA